MLTTFAVAMVSSKPYLSDEIEVDSINGNAMVHEIRKRSPLLIPEDPFLVGGLILGFLKKVWLPKAVKVNPIAQFNSLYAQCAFGTKIGLQTSKVLYPTLFGPLGKAYVALLPVVAPPVGKLFLAGICPKLALSG